MNSVFFAPDESTSLCIVVLCGAERAGWVHPRLADWITRFCVTRRQAFGIMSLHFVEICPVDRARNYAAKLFLESGTDYLLEFDNDAIPPANFGEFVDLAIADNKHFAVPLFHGIGVLEADSLTLNWNARVHPVRSGDINPHGWLELNSAGGHAMLIHRSVFEKISPPWFQNLQDELGTVRSEDVAFCDKARAAGLQIFGNVNFTVGHAKTANLATFADRLGPAQDMCGDDSTSIKNLDTSALRHSRNEALI